MLVDCVHMLVNNAQFVNDFVFVFILVMVHCMLTSALLHHVIMSNKHADIAFSEVLDKNPQVTEWGHL